MTFVDFDNCHGMASAKIVLYDLDLLFEDQKFEMLISLKWLELVDKTFFDFDICNLQLNGCIVKIVLHD